MAFNEQGALDFPASSCASMVKQTPERPSIPGPGIVLSSETERRAASVRQAVAGIQRFLSSPDARQAYGELFATDETADSSTSACEPIEQKAAWALASVYILARCLKAIASDATLEEAGRWFAGNSSPLTTLFSCLPKTSLSEFQSYLGRLTFDSSFADLLPYILEPHGPGTRLSVVKDPGTQKARQQKREAGVFYTPSDVAEYIAAEVLSRHGGPSTKLRALDPACGTGVFLRALLRIVGMHDSSVRRFEYATSCLFGIDISELAIQSACFILLHDCLVSDGVESRCPFQAWRRLRMNFVARDALTILAQKPSNVTFTQALGFSCAPLGAVEGFDLILGNPPYASLGERPDIRELSDRFSCIPLHCSPHYDLYPLFIEMMWHLANPERHAAGMVVPLSIAYHRGKQITTCRTEMRRIGGRWYCAFFDREPHALFGEDVKTRNAIIFHIKGPDDLGRQRALIYCSPMHKWTSRSRAGLFGSISFTCVDHIDIAPGIPKLRGEVQAQATLMLQQRSTWFREFVERSFPTPLEDVFHDINRPCLFVGSTAYNFINVLMPHPRPRLRSEPLTQNPLTGFAFSDMRTARAAFALLSSRLVFWWWHVHCDGFHVPRWFLESIPFGRGAFSSTQLETLSALGERLWGSIQKEPVLSVNGGRQSLAYRPLKCEQLRTQIDAVLIQTARLPGEMVPELQKFVHDTITVDRTDRRLPGSAFAAPISEESEEEVASWN
ncbi:MAG TPA: N-6 DNA methylase [Candidatus Angelobacter sp.]